MRLPLTSDIDSRDGVSNRDERLTNMLGEDDEGVTFTVVRPGLVLDAQASGVGHGLVVFNNELVSVYGATLAGSPTSSYSFNGLLLIPCVDGVVEDVIGDRTISDLPDLEIKPSTCGARALKPDGEVTSISPADTLIDETTWTVEGRFFFEETPTGTIKFFQLLDDAPIELSCGWSNGYFYIYWAGGVYSTTLTAGTLIPIREWVHVAWVHQASGSVQIFQNGVSVGLSGLTNLELFDFDTSTVELTLRYSTSEMYVSQIGFATSSLYTGTFTPSCHVTIALPTIATVVAGSYDFCQSPL